MSVCRTCAGQDFNVEAAAADLRHAIRHAQSTHGNAATYRAKIPALKAAFVEAKARRDEHAAECRVTV